MTSAKLSFDVGRSRMLVLLAWQNVFIDDFKLVISLPVPSTFWERLIIYLISLLFLALEIPPTFRDTKFCSCSSPSLAYTLWEAPAVPRYKRTLGLKDVVRLFIVTQRPRSLLFGTLPNRARAGQNCPEKELTLSHNESNFQMWHIHNLSLTNRKRSGTKAKYRFPSPHFPRKQNEEKIKKNEPI